MCEDCSWVWASALYFRDRRESEASLPVAAVPQRVEEDPARRAAVPRATDCAPRWGRVL